ncbi:MAG: HEAT repeat domain-containing protein [bacterium]
MRTISFRKVHCQMITFLFTLTLSFIFSLSPCLLAIAQDQGNYPEKIQRFLSDCEIALARNAMIWSDLSIRTDYATPDKFRLPLIDSLMQDPKITLPRVDEMATALENESLIAAITYILFNSLSLENTRKAQSQSLKMKSLCGNLAHLGPELRTPLEIYLSRLPQIADLRRKMIADLGNNLQYVIENSTKLIRSSTSVEEIDPFELHRIEKEEQAMGDSVLKTCESIDLDALCSASILAIEAAEDLKVSLQNLPPDIESQEGTNYGWRAKCEKARIEGGIIYMGMSDLGAVVIGGAGDNRYQGSFALIIDLGGKDTYNLKGDVDTPIKLIIDLDGDDHYSGDDFSIAGALLGVSIIFDLSGNDIYQAASASLGSAIGGLGVLCDFDGDDIYCCDAFGQGAGFLGVGILCDAKGNDSYTAGMNSQGFGYVMGAGCLLERSGNDIYYTKMSQTDILRYDDHYLTLSQGCAFGWRPHYSGGMGLLLECEGNDLYSSDIFGQGVGYWFAIGALVDRGGHDRYISYQYAQGAGIHLALGILIDNSGNDSYQSKGVSQGCGHDLAFGLLADFSGSDSYTAYDLSQGAGNANATGILYDSDGVDSYSSKSEINVNGYGDFRREFGSIGLHIDCAGKDFYGAVGENNSLWKSGKYGLGIDLPQDAATPSGDLIVKEFPFEEREYTTEELFILASRGEPRFRKWHSFAFEKMVQESLSSIEYLRTILDTEDARERHTIKDILVRIGEPAVDMLCDAVRSGNDLAKAEASWILGLIGSSKAFDALVDLSRDESWKLRSNGLNSLGKLKGLNEREAAILGERLEEILADTGEVYYVKKDAAFSAGAQSLSKCLPALVNLLSDRHFSARLSAAEAIGEICKDWEGGSDFLLAKIDTMDQLALLSLLKVACTFEDDLKLKILKKLSQSRRISDENAPLFAQVLTSIEPRTGKIGEDLKRLREYLSQDHWEIEAILRE